jgi:transposase
MQAAELFASGIAAPEVAKRLRVTPKSAYQWRRAWTAGGAAALASRGPGGQRCKLGPALREKLAAMLEEGPAAHGWNQDQVWTGARVATLIGRRFHVSYSVSGATRLMHRLGFTAQLPARRAAERDEAAVAAWKETTWPQIKGRGRPPAAGSASRTRPASTSGRHGDAPGAGAAAPRS